MSCHHLFRSTKLTLLCCHHLFWCAKLSLLSRHHLLWCAELTLLSCHHLLWCTKLSLLSCHHLLWCAELTLLSCHHLFWCTELSLLCCCSRRRRRSLACHFLCNDRLRNIHRFSFFKIFTKFAKCRFSENLHCLKLDTFLKKPCDNLNTLDRITAEFKKIIVIFYVFNLKNFFPCLCKKFFHFFFCHFQILLNIKAIYSKQYSGQNIISEHLPKTPF